ncbi:MAG: phosphodiester glycosidase family protein [Ignavibacteria bacterium]|nr:phosphodiester glycosidase family protein [Ignavibacteria bacterium]
MNFLKHHAFALLWFCVLSSYTLRAQDFRILSDGVEYAQLTRQVRSYDTTAPLPCVVNLLRIDGTKAALQLVHSMDAAIGVETTSSLAKRYNALAATNAGFFRIGSIFAGDAAGVLQIDGKLLSEPHKERVACGIINRDDKSDLVFGHLKWKGEAQIGTLRFGNNPAYPLAGINRQREVNEMVLFTPEFHRTTLTTTGGIEIVVQNGLVTSLHDSIGSTFIPPDGLVLSCSGAAREWALANVRVGMKAATTMQIEPLKSESAGGFRAAEDIVGGVSQLLEGGKIALTWQREGAAEDFALGRHPRTAIAKLRDGRMLLATVDGRQIGVSAGMTLEELAQMLVEYGATDAVNLDGGGSTTMVVGGKIVNKPSDTAGERTVSDALLVFPRKKH